MTSIEGERFLEWMQLISVHTCHFPLKQITILLEVTKHSVASVLTV